MKTLGNILWHFPFLGFVSATLVYVLGLFLTFAVITAPIGLGLIEFGKFLFLPFGHAMVSKTELNIKQNKYLKNYSIFLMILYFPFGILLSLIAVIQFAGLFLSIVGIPAALVVAKSIGTYFNPVNKKCVHVAVKDEIEKKKAQAEVEKYLTADEEKVSSEFSIEPWLFLYGCLSLIIGLLIISAFAFWQYRDYQRYISSPDPALKR